MTFNPYLRRDGESERAHWIRCLECPILGPEVLEEIADISGARLAMLSKVRDELVALGREAPRGW